MKLERLAARLQLLNVICNDYEAMPRLAAAINERWGRLDGFVANASDAWPSHTLSHLKNSVWDDTIAINLTLNGAVKAMEPLLLLAEAGRAVLVSSGVAEGIKPFWGAYAISKAGLEAMGRSGPVKPKKQIYA